MVPPPAFNIAVYQEKIDAITGKSRGEPILRLEWGGDAYITRHDVWDEFGQPLSSVKLPRFALSRTHPVDSSLVEYIPIRRWIITQRQEPEQIEHESNTFTDNRGVTCEIGDKPLADYTPLIYVGDHSQCSPDCCSERICLGDYKEPDNAELEWIAAATQKLHAEFKADPYSADNEMVVNDFVRDEIYKKEKEQEAADADYELYFKDWWKTHGHRITTDDPSVLQHGKYKFFRDGKPI